MYKAIQLLGLKQAVNDDFMEHVALHGLSYGTQAEYAFRQEIFLAKDAEYKLINADPANTFTVGHNFLSTWTKDEYKRLLGYKGEADLTAAEPTVLDVAGTPTAVAWCAGGKPSVLVSCTGATGSPPPHWCILREG